MNKHFVINADDIIVECSSLSSFGEEKNEYCHDRYELICFIGGNGKYVVEGKEYSVSPKSVLFLRPLAYHCVRVQEEGVDFISIKFSPSVLNESVLGMLESLSGDNSDCSRFYRSVLVNDALLSVFERLEHAGSMSENVQREYLRALLIEAIVFLSSISADISGFTDEELGARVVRYLNSNIEKNVSLDKLARRFFVSKYYLCRAFKKYSGTSVHSYINHKRIMYAKQLIESGESASGAAYKVGFGDYSAFYRAYVKIVGKSPTAD